ncbi:MAG: hypothetical protein V3W41_08465 [Planctomycetota bacterium]
MRPKLPDNLRRTATLEVWVTPSELEEFRHLAVQRGFRRRVPGSEPAVYRGDLSRLVQVLLQEAAADQKTWRRLLPRLQANMTPTSKSRRGDLVKFQMRVREVWLLRIRKLAEESGHCHGGRGNVSAFVRSLLQLQRRDAAQRG